MTNVLDAHPSQHLNTQDSNEHVMLLLCADVGDPIGRLAFGLLCSELFRCRIVKDTVDRST